MRVAAAAMVLFLCEQLCEQLCAELDPESIKCYNDYETTMTCELNAGEPTDCKRGQTIIFRYENVNDITCSFATLLSMSSSTRCECKTEMPKFVHGDEYRLYLSSGGNDTYLKNVIPVKNIKPRPPHKLAVKQGENGNYFVNWSKNYTKESFIYDYLHFQLSYKKKGEPDKNAQTVNVSSQHFEILQKELQPGYEYVLKVRSYASDYNSQFSDWSEELEWKIRPGLLEVLKVSISVLCVLLIVAIFACYRCYTKVKKNYWDDVPDPSKSHIPHVTPNKYTIPVNVLQSSHVFISPVAVIPQKLNSAEKNPWTNLMFSTSPTDVERLLKIIPPKVCVLEEEEGPLAPLTDVNYQGCFDPPDLKDGYPQIVCSYALTEGQNSPTDQRIITQAHIDNALSALFRHQGLPQPMGPTCAFPCNMEISNAYKSFDNGILLENENLAVKMGSPPTLTDDGQLKHLCGSEGSCCSSESGYKSIPYSWVSASSHDLVLSERPPFCAQSLMCCGSRHHALKSASQTQQGKDLQSCPVAVGSMKAPIPSDTLVLTVSEYQALDGSETGPLPARLGSVENPAWFPEQLNEKAQGMSGTVPSAPEVVTMMDEYQSFSDSVLQGSSGAADFNMVAVDHDPKAFEQRIAELLVCSANPAYAGLPASVGSLPFCDEGYQPLQNTTENTDNEKPFIHLSGHMAPSKRPELHIFPDLDETLTHTGTYDVSDSSYQSLQKLRGESEADSGSQCSLDLDSLATMQHCLDYSYKKL
ncbi:interleukin-4 receptor subunit alpha [Amia ocellicauda]|uniref:interleukin-4 receptor subunit alpha n=1 Tax=Amia ocellicauda TaxID=2972642 RepID=UPI00346429B5